MNAAQALREARRRAGLTQRTLAERVGGAQSVIARIESGDVTPRVDTLERLLKACGAGLSVSPLVEGVDRTQLTQALRRSHTERSRVAEESVRSIYEAMRGTRTPAGLVREDRPPAYRESIFRLLAQHEVDYILIGGVAGNVHGSPIATVDVDVCYERSKPNLERLGSALIALHAYPRGWPDGLPFVPDAQTLANTQLLTLGTDLGDLDVLAFPSGVNGYEELAGTAVEVDLGGVKVRVCSLESLIRMKQAAGRPKDLWALEILRALREESGG